MPGLELVTEKLIKMKDYLNQLKNFLPSTYQDYIKDLLPKYAVERLIQLIVDLSLDINNIILAYLKRPPASDYFNSFIDLAEYGVLEDSFATKIAPSTGLRNRLIHEYEAVNDRIVFESIDETIEQYTLYMKEINQYINLQK
jgi:uncharacterized protein YutE (UPF0331/DUF86 family)